MIDFAHTNPFSLAAVALGWASLFLFLFLGRQGGRSKRAAKLGAGWLSLLGLFVQLFGFVVAFWGPLHFAEPLFGRPALLAAGIVSGMILIAFLLLHAASGALRAVEGGLATGGPYALVRHPIYLAILLMTIATGLGLGHLPNLMIAVPLALAGTELRIVSEETRLLARFGDAWEAYAKRVKRLVPLVW